MRPEVYGAISLACREINKAANILYRNTSKGKKQIRKHQEKIQKHLSRAEKYNDH